MLQVALTLASCRLLFDQSGTCNLGSQELDFVNASTWTSMEKYKKQAVSPSAARYTNLYMFTVFLLHEYSRKTLVPKSCAKVNLRFLTNPI
jgi:hypothetical protein